MSTKATFTSSRSPNVKPRVLIVVSGGVADFIADEGVDVVIFDWDDYESAEKTTPKPPQRFADLAAECDIPVSSDLAFATS